MCQPDAEGDGVGVDAHGSQRSAWPDQFATPDDWSIQPTGACGRECRECRDLDAFLVDPTRRAADWRLKEQYRSHLENRIATHELPDDHHTIRSGRPYTITLAKAPSLFEREAEQRRDDDAAVTWLSRRMV